MKVIGLTGFAKSGKSTAAEVLKELGGVEVAFAKHLKDVCALVFDIERLHFDDQAYKEVPFVEPIILDVYQIKDILEFFEVPQRLMPAAMLTHNGVELKSPRHVAQYVGTELLRGIDSDIHIKMAFKLNENTSARFLICSDVRFENELVAVQRQDGLMIGISRKAATPADLESLHPSEKEVPSLIKCSDYEIENEGTREDFQDAVRRLATDYLSK